MAAELSAFWQLIITICNVSTIGVCMVAKLPQIKTVLSAGSGKGLSVNSVLVELFGLSIILGYNVIQGYPILSYLEIVFLVVQDIFLILIIYRKSGTLDVLKLGILGVHIAAFYSFSQGIPHPGILPALMKVSMPLFAWSKLLQIQAIWSCKSSETVSVATWSIAAYTCVARLTTNQLLTGDFPLMLNYSVSLVLNLTIIGSALYFRLPNKSETKSKKSSPKKKTK